MAASSWATDSAPITGGNPPAIEEEEEDFELLKRRKFEKEGLTVDATLPTTPVGTIKPPPTWAEQEAERQAEFDKQFGEGTYRGIIRFSDNCRLEDGCNKLGTGRIIKTAYTFVNLEKDVKNNVVVPKSPAYETRHKEIKTGLRAALDVFKPKPGQTTGYTRELIRVTHPIVKQVFTKEEQLEFARNNAANSNSAPAYTYLGQNLNAAGPPGRAKQAFDLALQRDPNSQEALSGRAQAKFNLGDFPGAAADAGAALKLDPADRLAYATLKLSEGRGAGKGGEGAGSALPASGAGAEGSALGAAGGAQLGQSGAGGSPAPSPEALARSRDLATQAKRSLGMGEPAAALETLRRATALNPENVQALSLAAMAYSRLKDYPAALAAAEAGLKLAPDSAALLASKAFALNHMKDYRGALAAADRALELNPRDAMAHFNRAAALGGLRDREGMLAALRAAAELDAKFQPILDAAITMPDDGDIMLLLPGEQGARPSSGQGAKAPGGGKAFPLWGAGLLAGAFLGLLFLAQRKPAPAAPPPPLRAARPAAAVPALLGGKFEVGRQLGAGGMGVVYAGQDRSLDRPVAIKRMREEIRYDEKARKSFIAEARLVAKLKHPSIVEIHAIVEEDTEVFLVFEYVSGQTLDEVLKKEGRLPFERARDLFRGVASALEYAQGRGVIHRDLKPANLMVDGDGRVRVMDFGIARLAEEALSRRTMTNASVGTPSYMAPEQEQSVARRESDVYSMAVCFYEALTGRVPFGGGSGAGLLVNKLKKTYEPASAFAPLPPGLDEVFAKAFEPDPDKRYATAEKFMRALESLESVRRA